MSDYTFIMKTFPLEILLSVNSYSTSIVSNQTKFHNIVPIGLQYCSTQNSFIFLTKYTTIVILLYVKIKGIISILGKYLNLKNYNETHTAINFPQNTSPNFKHSHPILCATI